jgi:hypothetical protein
MIESVSQLAHDFAKYKRVPYGLLLNSLIAKLGGVFSFNKVQFQLINESPHIANVYSFGLTNSGGGKNKSLSDLDESFFEKIYFEIDNELKKDFQFKLSEIEDAANNFAKRKNQDGKEWIDHTAKQQYIKEYSPRKLSYMFDNFSPEGLIAERYEMFLSSRGGSFLFENTEFLSFLSKQASEKSDCISLLAEIYDKGTNKAKVIKSDKEAKKISKKVPQNLIAYAPIDSMHDDKSYNLLLNIIKSAFARRSFFYFEENLQKEILTIEQKKLLREEVDVKEFQLNDFFLDKFNKTKPKEEKGKYIHKVYMIQKDSIVDDLYLGFEEFCEKQAEIQKNRIIYNELVGRPWKTIKLATILQCVYNPDSEFIEEKAMAEAIDISNYFGKFLFNLIHNKPKNSWQSAYDFYLENLSKPISMTTLNEKGFFGITNFKRHFEDFEIYASFRASEEGYIFERVGGKGNSKLYVLKKIEEKLQGE